MRSMSGFVLGLIYLTTQKNAYGSLMDERIYANTSATRYCNRNGIPECN